jgi:hypothetical protein
LLLPFVNRMMVSAEFKLSFRERPSSRCRECIMPFLTRCLFCGQQVRAPDHALGASLRCPKCSNFFTLAPERAVAQCGPQASPLKQKSEAGPIAESSLLPKGNLVIADAGLRPKPGRIDPLGLSALLLGGAALLSASAPSLCRWVMPLSGVGLLLGLVALPLARGRSRLPFPITGTAAAGMVLLAALLFPTILGPVYLASRGVEAVAPNMIRVVPLVGSLHSATPGDPEWADASWAALHQGPMRVQVVSVSVHPLKAKSSPTKTIVTGEYLFIRLRIHRAEAAGEFAAKRAQKPGGNPEQLRPSLRDKTGRVYQPRDVQEVAVVENQRKSALFPVSFLDEVLVFEAPFNDVDYLRLEVPAEAWGGKGAFRFTIPGSMIESKRSSPAGLAAGR